MARQRRKTRQSKTRQSKTRQDNVFDTIVGFAQAVDTVFEKLTGKPLASWFNEFQQQPRELPEGETAAPSESVMPLADAYAVLGLPQNCSLSEIKKRYRDLANLFHPDKGGYAEAMVLLNNAYERIKKENKG
jgi:DnaJ-domain-containing protein 1